MQKKHNAAKVSRKGETLILSHRKVIVWTQEIPIELLPCDSLDDVTQFLKVMAAGEGGNWRDLECEKIRFIDNLAKSVWDEIKNIPRATTKKADRFIPDDIERQLRYSKPLYWMNNIPVYK